MNNVADLVNEVATASYGSTKIIRLEPGMYILDRHIAINSHDIFIVGNGSGNPIANADIAPDPMTMAIISRNINGASHELFRVYSNGKLTLFNVVLQYGGGANMGWGGGIVNQGSELHAVLTRFDQNTTWGGGGAIVNVEDGRVTVENSVFTENIGGDGGLLGH